jgi:hypothetical protein
MAVAYKSQGAGAGTETSGAALNLVCPATVDANDILIAHVSHTGTGTAPTDPADWTLLSGPHNIGQPTAVGRSWVYGKLAIGDEDGDTISFGTAGGTQGRWGRIYSFSGWVSGTITDVVPAESFTNVEGETSTISMPSVTTTVDGALAVALCAIDDNNAQASATGESGGNWAEAVAEFTDSGLGAQGVSCGIQTAAMAMAGTISGGTFAQGSTDESSNIGFEIRPEAAGTPIEVDLTAVTESDSAVGLSFIKTIFKTLVPVTETDVAVALDVAGPIVMDITPVTSTDSARPLTFTKTIRKTLAPVAETDAAQTLAVTKTIFKSVVPVTETDTAVALNVGAGPKTISPVTETDTAQPLTKFKRVTLTPVTTTETAQPLVVVKTIFVSITPTVETDAAVALNYAVTGVVVPASIIVTDVFAAIALVSLLATASVSLQNTQTATVAVAEPPGHHALVETLTGATATAVDQTP